MSDQRMSDWIRSRADRNQRSSTAPGGRAALNRWIRQAGGGEPIPEEEAPATRTGADFGSPDRAAEPPPGPDMSDLIRGR